MATIELREITKSYGKRIVLGNLSLTVHDGECFTLLGPSGCGKTVLLRLIAGFEAPDSGVVRIGDSVVADGASGDMLPPDRRGLGVVFQDYAVWPHKTVFDNIAYPLQLAKVDSAEIRRRVMEVVEQVNLTGLEKRMPSQLSGGQQQRVALARALVARPALLLLDEPLCNLDANLREEMRFEIKVLQRSLGVTILYVTHDQEIGLAISDRVAIMDESGAIRQIGTPEEVYERPVDDFVFRFMGISNFVPVQVADGVARLESGRILPWAIPEKAVNGTRWNVGFRPSDVHVFPEGQGLSAVVRRASFLGAMTEYRIDLGGCEIRTEVETLHALRAGTMFRDAQPCSLRFDELQWFPAAGTGEGA